MDSRIADEKWWSVEMNRASGTRERGRAVRWLIAVVVAIAAMSPQDLLPQAAPAAGLTPTAVLGWSPGVTRDVPLSGRITIHFNRAVDRASVLHAWHMSPSVNGTFHWGRTSVTFQPNHPLKPGSYYRLTIDRTASGTNAVPMTGAFSLAFSTGDGLKVRSYSPWNGTRAVPVNGLIAITFNHPMVPLAGSSAAPRNPPGWSVSISPRLSGHGSWLGTSTWVFHPNAGLQPSSRYTVALGRSVRDAFGEPLGRNLRWSFRTVTPQVYSRSPRNGSRFADPRGPITVTFNQPMDRTSTARAFSVRVSGVPVPGRIGWKGATLVFQPSSPLSSDQPYRIAVEGFARSSNGRATLGKRVRWQFEAAPSPQVVGSDPGQGGRAYDVSFRGYGGPIRAGYHYFAQLYFNTPMNKSSLDHHLTISPSIPRLDTSLYGPNEASQFVYGIAGDFKPSSQYDITIGAGVKDAFGRLLSAPYTLHLKTARLRPTVALYGIGGTQAISVSAGRATAAPIQFVNIPKVSYTLVHTTLSALSQMGYGNNAGPPAGKTIRRWTEEIPHPLNKVENLGVKLVQKDGSPLPPGLYWLGAMASGDVPGLAPTVDTPNSWEVVTVTDVSTTAKTGGNGTLVWVTSAQNGEPMSGVRVKLVNYQGNTIASGMTDGRGTHFFRQGANRGSLNAVVDDHAHFGMAMTSWTPLISSPEMVSPFWWRYQPSSNGTYLYTDRPVYRPGQRVHFRGVLWRDRDGVYSLLGGKEVAVQAMSSYSGPSGAHPLYQARLRLDRFGAVHGSFLLPRNTPTGSDFLGVSIPGSIGVSANFSVAEYRKPEFVTNVTSGRPSYVQGQTVTATVKVRYVFGAPVVRQRVSWTAYAQPQYPHPPGWQDYSFFDWETLWQQILAAAPNGCTGDVPCSSFGKQVGQGAGMTDAQGRMTVHLPVDLSKEIVDQTVTIEGTTVDINHQPVSGRAQLPEYKSALAIGLSAEHQVVPAGQPVTVDVAAVRHDGKPTPNQHLTAKIFKRTYTSKLVNVGSGQTAWQAVPQDTLVDTQTLTTDAHGEARVSFTPREGGEYAVSVEGKDELGNVSKNALSVYASAEGFSDWGLTPSTSIPLKPDRATYRVGDTAHILVAAPFDRATALVTVERGNIRKFWVQHLQTNSGTVDVPITLADLPNVYVTVTLYRGWRGDSPPDWRYGTTQLHVRVDPKHLVVHLKQTSYRHHPGDPVTYSVTTTDVRGHPVSAQLSLALVDTAALALQDETNADILRALYSDRLLGVTTASDGAVSINHLQVKPDFPLQSTGGQATIVVPGPGGGPAYGPVQGADQAARAPAAPSLAGGGGGCGPGCGQPVTLRSRFADTAYWSGGLVTDASGHATLQLRLPDNATTWRLDARGVTAGQGVGQAQLRTLATQDLILRPVVPRFLVEGDTLQVGAIVNNNLARAVGMRVSVVASGLTVRAGSGSSLQVPAHGERLLLWRASVPEGRSARLTFSASPWSPGVRGDAVRLSLPVHPPLTDETVATSGQVFGGMRQLVIVPRGAVSRPGALTVQISSSLTAGLGAAYREFRPRENESNEDVANRVLVAASLRSLPQTITGLAPSTYRNLSLAIAAGVQKLLDHQYYDGGWRWFDGPGAQSDPWTTGDVVQALTASGWHGPLVRQAMARGQNYLRNQLASVPASERSHLLLVLAQSGANPRSLAESLYHNSVQRSHLDNGPLADLGRTLALVRDGTSSRSVVSVLDARAVVSATGAHWESSPVDYWSGPVIATTTQALATLLSISPHDPFVPAAVRWLMLARQGDSWDCPRDSAQAIAVLAAYARAAREGTADYRYTVMVDNAVRHDGQYNQTNQRSVSSTRVAISRLHRRGASALEVSREPQNGTFGPGPLYYVARLHYYLRANAVVPRSEGVSVSRRYLTLKGQPIAQTAAGSAVQVELTVHTDQTLFFLDVEDPIPVGFEPIDETLNTSQQGLFRPPQFSDSGPFQPGRPEDLRWFLSHSDLRDNRVSLYAYYLPPGTYRYTYLAQATVPGSYGVAPTHVSETYFPEVFGRSAGQVFRVR